MADFDCEVWLPLGDCEEDKLTELPDLLLILLPEMVELWEWEIELPMLLLLESVALRELEEPTVLRSDVTDVVFEKTTEPVLAAPIEQRRDMSPKLGVICTITSNANGEREVDLRFSGAVVYELKVSIQKNK